MSLRFAYFFATLSLCFFLPKLAKTSPKQTTKKSTSSIEHVLTILHPGDSEAKARPHTLLQNFDAQGEPKSYSMWVDSVICREKTCDVVQVQLVWDALGRYQSYQVALGSELTKLDHVPFNQQELDKLQSILKDADSPLKEVEKEAMTAKVPDSNKTGQKLPNGVAAVSQPTVLTLKTAVILGAGYTCYDLWHWSNGLLTDHIRDFTAKDSSQENLLSYLHNEDEYSASFALKALTQREISEPAVLEQVINRSKKGSHHLMVATLTYLKKNTSNKLYEQNLLRLFAEQNTKKRLFILEELTTASPAPDKRFYQQLSSYLPKLETYFEVHLFLNLIQKSHAQSALINKQATQLLKHQKFFVSRRACAYLIKQKLRPDLQKKVDDYRQRHKDRL